MLLKKRHKIILNTLNKGGSLCKVRVLNFLIRYFSNYYTLHRSDLAARAAPLDLRLLNLVLTLLLYLWAWATIVDIKVWQKLKNTEKTPPPFSVLIFNYYCTFVLMVIFYSYNTKEGGGGILGPRLQEQI